MYLNKPLVTCWASQPPVEQVSLEKTLTLAMNSPSMRKLACVRQERCFPVIHLYPLWKLHSPWPRIAAFPYDNFSCLPAFVTELQNGNCALEFLLFFMTYFSELPTFVTESPNVNCALLGLELLLFCLTSFLGFCQSYDRFYFLLGKLACPSGPPVNGNLFST